MDVFTWFIDVMFRFPFLIFCFPLIPFSAFAVFFSWLSRANPQTFEVKISSEDNQVMEGLSMNYVHGITRRGTRIVFQNTPNLFLWKFGGDVSKINDTLEAGSCYRIRVSGIGLGNAYFQNIRSVEKIAPFDV